MTAHQWLALGAVVVLVAGGYRYSLWRHPAVKCRRCKGTGRHRGAVWKYAGGDCSAPRCKGGRVPRWGVRLTKLPTRKKKEK